MALDALDVALRVATAFDVAGIDYFLGGSLATSIHGEPRATNDIDFVADVHAASTARLIDALAPGGEFAVDADALREAVLRRGTLNFFYLPLFTKIDLFMRRVGPFDESEFRRRRLTTVRDGRSIFVKTPEDSVLRKLLWFVSGGRQSDRQWRDVVSVLRVGGDTLDADYLEIWAQRLDLVDLLASAHVEARRGA